jgi:hypothetical protein
MIHDASRHTRIHNSRYPNGLAAIASMASYVASAVAGAEPRTRVAPCVVGTAAGFRITPIVGGVSECGERSSLARAKPHATRAAATTTPAVEPPPPERTLSNWWKPFSVDFRFKYPQE